MLPARAFMDCNPAVCSPPMGHRAHIEGCILYEEAKKNVTEIPEHLRVRAEQARKKSIESIGKPTTVAVPIKLLEKLKTVYYGSDEDYMRSQKYGCNIVGGWGDCEEITDLLKFIPEPEWEPPVDLIDLYCRAIGTSDASAKRALQAMHKQGIKFEF